VRLFGKAKPFSGKRVRTVLLTPFAMEVLRVFEKIFKPMFPRRAASGHLFRDEDGDRLTGKQYYKTFRKIVELARDAGVPIPEKLRPHDLRRTCSTNELEENRRHTGNFWGTLATRIRGQLLLTLLQLMPMLKMSKVISSIFLSIHTLRNWEQSNAN
jgi:integrase